MSNSSKNERLDQLLVFLDLVASRSRARDAIARGEIAGPTIVNECLPRAAAEPSAPSIATRSAPTLPSITVTVGATLAEAERQITLATLEHLGRHKEKTAATLGISLKTLYNRLKEYSSADSSEVQLGDFAAHDAAIDPVR